MNLSAVFKDYDYFVKDFSIIYKVLDFYHSGLYKKLFQLLLFDNNWLCVDKDIYIYVLISASQELN